MRRWAMPLLLATLVVGLLLAGPANHADAQGATAPGLTAASAQGNLIYADYDQALDESHTPPPNAYVIRINGKRTTVQNVAVSGQRVTLTLQAATIDGDTVLLTYRHKAQPTLRSVSGVNATTVRNVAVEVLSPEAVVETFEPEQSSATREVSGQAADDFIPTNFRADILAAGLRYRWNAPSSGTVRGYELRWKGDANLGTGATVQALGSGTLEYRATRGTNAKVFGQVRAQDDSDGTWGPWTHVLYGTGNFATNRTKPDAPDAPTVTPGNGQLTATWTAPADNGYSIIRYWVRHKPTSRTSWQNGDRNRRAWMIADGGALSHTIENLTNGQTYDVQVLADSLAGQSAWSATTTGTPSDPTATVAANSATITEGSDAVFTVTLNPAPSSDLTVNYGITVSGNYGVSAATNRTLTVGTTGTGTITLPTTNDTLDEANGSVTVTLATGTGYSLGDTNTSASVTVNDDDEAPAVPDGLSVARGNTNTSLFLQWNHKTGATSYHIQYATNSTFTIGAGTVDVSVPAEPPTQMTHYLGGLATGSGYYIRIASENANARSGWSATVGREQPRNVAVVEPVADSVTEGHAAQFRFSVSPSDVQRRITYNVTVSGDFGVSAATSLTIDVTGSETLDLATTDDGAIEENGSITVTITHVTGSDYFAGTPGSATVAVQDAGSDAGSVTDYDSDNDSLIEVDSLAKLNAIRYDPDGDALVGDNINTGDIDEAAAYAAAFPNPAEGMGCGLTDHDGDRNTPDRPVCTGYELTANLDFDTDVSGDANDGDTYWNGGDGWVAIGNSPRFTATFEGNGNTIANLFIDRDRTDYLGLFARLDNATVRNLTLTGASVTGDDRVGLLAGRSYETTVISGVSVSGDVTAGDDRAGVLIGETSDDTTIEDSSTSGSVTGNGFVGGLVGENNGAISRSRSSANVSGDRDAASIYLGGLVGITYGDITASFATGSVGPLGSGDDVDSAGGLVGEIGHHSTNIIDITASYATGSVTGNDDVGGLIGRDEGQSSGIVASYATGAVTGSENVGGLIGSVLRVSVRVIASYSTGAVTGTTNAGGLIGGSPANLVVTDSYWDTESSGLSTSAAGTGKTGAELRAPTGYTGIYEDWNDLDGNDTADSTTYWDFGENYNYPTLKVDFNGDGTATSAEFGDQKGPGPVQNLSVVEVGGQARVTWAAPSGAAGTITYELRSRYDDGGTASWSNWVAATSPHTLSLPAVGQTLRVEVRAVGTAAHSRSQAESGSVAGPAVQTDYDDDNDGLIDVDSLAKLNAIRYDLDGNGVADDTDNNAAYATAFPNPASNQCDNPVSTATETCTGYELMASLDFDTNGNGSADSGDTYWDGGAGWLPIAGARNIGANEGFQATFEGNGGEGYTISNLFINREYATDDIWAGYRMGLFGAVGDMAVIRNLTLTAVSVTGEEEVGGLAGISLGEIDAVDVTGTVTGATIDVGGLVGFLLRGSLIDSTFNGTVSGTASHMGGLVGANTGATIRDSEATGTVTASGSSSGHVGGLAGSNTGTIATSYSTSTVHANDAYWVGGLVGTNGGPYAKGSGRIIACYANNAVNGKGDVGGLVGENYASISTSYSTGDVVKHGGEYAGLVGGLVGRNELNNNDSTVYYSVTNSYWDSDLTTQRFGVGSDDADRDNVLDSGETNTLEGHTTLELQTPTGYDGIYSAWNVDVDGDGTDDDPWDFEADNQYPVLK